MDMDQQVCTKCAGIIALLLLMCNINNHFAVEAKRLGAVKHLDPKSHRRYDRCDLSEFVQNFKPEKLRINCDNIHEVKIGKLLGSGNVREVFEGEFHGRKVAVKKMKEGHVSNDRVALRITKGAAVLFQLRGASNIVHLVGFCNTTVVLDRAAGTLDQIILDRKQEISVKRALQMALDITKGLQQMHTVSMGPVIHGDIFYHQFLFTNRGKLLLGDMEKAAYGGYSNSNENCRRTANSPFDDIYRTALILWMLRSRQRPKNICWRKIDSIRPDVEEMSDYPQAMQDLIVQAWDEDSTKRPSATEMMQRIEVILRDYDSSSII